MTDPAEILPPEVFEKILTYYFHDVGPVQFMKDVVKFMDVSVFWYQKVHGFMAGGLTLSPLFKFGGTNLTDIVDAFILSDGPYIRLVVSDETYVREFLGEYYQNPFYDNWTRYNITYSSDYIRFPCDGRNYENMKGRINHPLNHPLKRLISLYYLHANHHHNSIWQKIKDKLESYYYRYICDIDEDTRYILRHTSETLGVVGYNMVARKCIKCLMYDTVEVYDTLAKLGLRTKIYGIENRNRDEPQPEIQLTPKWHVEAGLLLLAICPTLLVVGSYYLFKN